MNIPNNIIIENARISQRNFEGREVKPYNAQGVRNFTVRLDGEFAHVLENDGWKVNVKTNADGEEYGFLKVAVSYGSPRHVPKIVQITYDNNGRPRKTILNENTIGNIDSAEITDVKLEIRPRLWEVGGNSGIKAYLKTMYFTLVKDPFEDSYDFGDVGEGLPFDLGDED